ncbi:MAG TPA: TonB-dependent receptor, partial [Pseudacidobacterium sp.]|nr:TonB-dependent receptor [Pseudacidobacterium sp.]
VLVGVNYFDQVFLDLNTDFNPIALGFNTGASIPGAPHIQLGEQPTSQLGQIGVTPPLGRNDITGHLTNALSWTVGSHQFRFGGEFRQVQLDEFYHTDQRGAFIFSGTQGPWATAPTPSDSQITDTNVFILADYLGGYLYKGTIARGDPERQVFVNSFAVFGQDAWQLSRKFNLNYGIRYDYEGPLHNGNKDLSVFVPSKGGIVFQGAGISSVYPADYKSISPRLGFAWQPKEDGNLVIRGGVGLFFDTPNLNIFLSQNPGNGGAVGLQGNPAGPNPVLTLAIPSGQIVPGQLLAPIGADPSTECVVTPDNVSPCGLFSVNQNLRNPHNVNYSLNIQRGFGSKVVAQLGYVGSTGRKLILLRDINQPALNPAGSNVDPYTQQTSRPYATGFPSYGAINEAASAGDSNYNSLQAVLRMQNWHGLSSQASYTWSHSLDEGTQWRNVLPQDSTNIRGDYGNSDYDVRNTFTAFLTYDVPGSSTGPHWLSHGWQLNSLISLHGGTPFSVLSSSDNSGTGEGYQRAVQVLHNPFADISRKLVNQQVTWINPDAFAPGPTGTFEGTSRRNQLFGPGFESVDLSVFKTGNIGERVKVQFRAEMFNLFNRNNYAPPSNTVGAGFGIISDTIGDYNGAPGIGPGEPFNTQFGLKVIF